MIPIHVLPVVIPLLGYPFFGCLGLSSTLSNYDFVTAVVESTSGGQFVHNDGIAKEGRNRKRGEEDIC